MAATFKVKKNNPTERTTRHGEVITINPRCDYSIAMGETIVLDVKDYLRDTRAMAKLVCDALNAYKGVDTYDTLSFKLKDKK